MPFPSSEEEVQNQRSQEFLKSLEALRQLSLLEAEQQKGRENIGTSEEAVKALVSLLEEDSKGEKHREDKAISPKGSDDSEKRDSLSSLAATIYEMEHLKSRNAQLSKELDSVRHTLHQLAPQPPSPPMPPVQGRGRRMGIVGDMNGDARRNTVPAQLPSVSPPTVGLNLGILSPEQLAQLSQLQSFLSPSILQATQGPDLGRRNSRVSVCSASGLSGVSTLSPSSALGMVSPELANLINLHGVNTYLSFLQSQQQNVQNLQSGLTLPGLLPVSGGEGSTVGLKTPLLPTPPLPRSASIPSSIRMDEHRRVSAPACGVPEYSKQAPENKMNLSDILSILEDEEESCILTLRKIHKLGFKAAQALKMHFGSFGKISKILFLPSRTRSVDGAGEVVSEVRIRPASMGFLVFDSSEAANLAEGVHVIQGWPVVAQKFVRKAKPAEEEQGEGGEGAAREPPDSLEGFLLQSCETFLAQFSTGEDKKSMHE